jgi:hypothetical protein
MHGNVLLTIFDRVDAAFGPDNLFYARLFMLENKLEQADMVAMTFSFIKMIMINNLPIKGLSERTYF